jgi:hypothetical protein
MLDYRKLHPWDHKKIWLRLKRAEKGSAINKSSCCKPILVAEITEV